MSGVTGYRTAGIISVDWGPPMISPPLLLTISAPFETASSMRRRIRSVRFLFGSGVKWEYVVLQFSSPLSPHNCHGRPVCMLSMRSAIILLNSAPCPFGMKKSFREVQRCPLKLNAPKTDWSTALDSSSAFSDPSRNRSGKKIPMFFASSCKNTFNRWGWGCCRRSVSAAPDPPMKARASTFPVSINTGIVSRPRPATKFIAPGGRAF
mmetsp:Transcript_7856/g.19500  ORF Transcript_7856/g.19500 Transcript_7856/m.19500 type:complete len:208 (+) Transcript_7856:774-1397(+)